MSEVVELAPAVPALDRQGSRVLAVFAAWRLQTYGYTLAVLYFAFFSYLCWFGIWLVNRKGVPIYHDFTCAFVAGWLALHGDIASIYIPMWFIRAQESLVGAGHSVSATWPYLPTYFLILAPLAALPYVAAFLTWGVVTLLGCAAVVYLIVRRTPAIALVLASPFTVLNLFTGQSGFLMASLGGAALLALERQPVLAGVFIGCLAFKPQFGILFPVALVAGRQGRAFASTSITIALLTGISIAAFGIAPWGALPRQLIAQAGVNLFAAPEIRWLILQTVYGLVRRLNGSAALAWLAQGVATLGSATVVWLVWRSKVRYALKAAILSGGMLIATPYALAYDLAAIAIPIAFLAKDQIRCGLLPGEQTIELALFVAGCSLIPTAGQAPVGPPMLFVLLWLILRRVFQCR